MFSSTGGPAKEMETSRKARAGVVSVAGTLSLRRGIGSRIHPKRAIMTWLMRKSTKMMSTEEVTTA